MRAVTTFLRIRILVWVATSLALLWAPLPKAKAPDERGWGPLSDLVFGTFVQWDADWFLKIARDGYDSTSAAFFPLYPLVLHLLGSSIVTGTLVALGAGAAGAWAVAAIAPDLQDEAVPLLALFPTAYVFGSVYSDGLFLACSALAFLY